MMISGIAQLCSEASAAQAQSKPRPQGHPAIAIGHLRSPQHGCFRIDCLLKLLWEALPCSSQHVSQVHSSTHELLGKQRRACKTAWKTVEAQLPLSQHTRTKRKARLTSKAQ